MRKIFLIVAALIAAPVAAVSAQNIGPCNTPECAAHWVRKLAEEAEREAAKEARRAAEDAADCARRQARGAQCRPN